MPLWSPTNKWIEMGSKRAQHQRRQRGRTHNENGIAKEPFPRSSSSGWPRGQHLTRAGSIFPFVFASLHHKSQNKKVTTVQFLRAFCFSTSIFIPPPLILLFSHFTITSSMDYKQLSSLTSHQQPKINRAAARKLVRSGSVTVRERSTFSGTSWKPRKMELDGEALTIISVSIDVHALQK